MPDEDPTKGVTAPVIDDPDKEPGGEDPQAVRARKEYRARKAAVTALSTEREARLAAEARLAEAEKLTAAAPRKEEKLPSLDDIQKALDEGTITTVQAMDAISRFNTGREREAGVKEVQSYLAEERKAARALDQIERYREIAPWLDDPTDERRQEVQKEYSRLVNTFGMPHSLTTELLAVEKTLGTIEKLRQKSQVRSQDGFTNEGSAGGGATRPATPTGAGGNTQVERMPQHFKDFWERAKTPIKDREREAAIYFADKDRYEGKRL